MTICSECSIEFSVIIWHFINWLDFIKVEGKLAGNTTVQTCFQICCPILVNDVFASTVLLTYPCHSAVDCFSAIYIFNGVLSEEKVHIFTDVERANEVWFWGKNINIRFSAFLGFMGEKCGIYYISYL